MPGGPARADGAGNERVARADASRADARTPRATREDEDDDCEKGEDDREEKRRARRTRSLASIGEMASHLPVGEDDWREAASPIVEGARPKTRPLVPILENQDPGPNRSHQCRHGLSRTLGQGPTRS